MSHVDHKPPCLLHHVFVIWFGGCFYCCCCFVFPKRSLRSSNRSGSCWRLGVGKERVWVLYFLFLTLGDFSPGATVEKFHRYLSWNLFCIVPRLCQWLHFLPAGYYCCIFHARHSLMLSINVYWVLVVGEREASTNEQRESQVDGEVRMVHFMILRLWDGMKRKWYAFSKNDTFEFGSFPGLVICGTVLSFDAGRRQPATAPEVNKAITRVNNQHTDNRSVFHFQYLVQGITRGI